MAYPLFERDGTGRVARGWTLEIVPERVLVLFRPEQHCFGPVSEHFLFRHRTMRGIFARYLAYNITILQTIDITVSLVNIVFNIIER